MATSFDWYDANSEILCARYEEQRADIVHGWIADLLPSPHAIVLDGGAGSGRDAAWLVSKGYDVVAAEPSTNMRAAAARLHPEPQIRWVDDSLPGLLAVTRAGLSFNLILLSAVWMHVPINDRARAF